MSQSKCRKLIALFLVFMMALSCLPMSASATASDFEYTVANGVATIRSYKGNSTDVVIPDELGGCSLIEIDELVFAQSDITSLTLSGSVFSIGFAAFRSCHNLRTVNLGVGQVELGDYAFANCATLSSLYVPLGFAYIGSNAFNGCTSLTQIILPESLVYIHENAFLDVPVDVNIYFDGWEGTWNKIHFMAGNTSLEYSENITFANPCTHSYKWWEEVAATCSSTGLMLGQCSLCYKKASKDIPTNDNHNYKMVYDTPVDCIKDSLVHDECTDCGKILAGSSSSIPAEGHEFTVFVKYVAPTYTAKGKMVYGCMWCDYQLTIYEDKLPRTKLSGAKISVSNKTYTGKSIEPNPTVKVDGVRLKKGTDYTLSYKNNKKVGIATITIKGKGKYTGTRKVTFKIKPKKTAVSSAKSKKEKCVTVKWKKNSTASGYQIMFATNKKFTKNKKTVTIKKKSTKSTTVKKLKSKKTYYVKMRSYKTVKGKKIYSSWSDYKKVKVR